MSTTPDQTPDLPFSTPTQTFIAHLSLATPTPPYGTWKKMDEVIPVGQQAAQQRVGSRTETLLDHLIAGRFIEQDATKLRQLAERHGTTLQVDGSPFGTTFYVKFDLAAESDTWHITFDGFHVIASRSLQSSYTPDTQLIDGRLPHAIKDLVGDFDLAHVTSHLSWEWARADALGEFRFYPGILYRLKDQHLAMPGHSLTFKWAGAEASTYLPLYLAEVISLWLRADCLHMLLQQTTDLSLTLELPALPEKPTLKHQTDALQQTQAYWDDIRSTLPRFNAQGKLAIIARNFLDASQSFTQYGLVRRENNQAKRIIYGPYTATTEVTVSPGVRRFTIGNVTPEGAPRALDLLGLHFAQLQAVLRNVEAARVDYENQAAIIRDLIGMNTSLLSAQTAIENAKIANSAKYAAWAAAALAVTSIIATVFG